MISPTTFLHSLTPKIYKLMPMREELENGSNIFLDEYVESLKIELIGALDTYEVLSDDGYYHAIVNTVQYMSSFQMSLTRWRSEVKKMLRLIDKLVNAVGGEDDG